MSPYAGHLTCLGFCPHLYLRVTMVPYHSVLEEINVSMRENPITSEIPYFFKSGLQGCAEEAILAALGSHCFLAQEHSLCCGGVPLTP